MEAREKRTSGRRANRTTGIVISKLHPLRRETVNVRGRKLLLPIATEIGVTGVVEQDVNDVRLFRSGGGAHETGKQGQSKKEGVLHR